MSERTCPATISRANEGSRGGKNTIVAVSGTTSAKAAPIASHPHGSETTSSSRSVSPAPSTGHAARAQAVR